MKSAALAYHAEQGPLKSKVEIMTEEMVLHNILYSLYNELEERETRMLRNRLGDFRLVLASAISTETQLYGNIHWAQLPDALTEAWTLFKHGHGPQATEMFKRTLCTPLLPDSPSVPEDPIADVETVTQSVPEDPKQPIGVETDEDKNPGSSEPTTFYAVAAEA